MPQPRADVNGLLIVDKPGLPRSADPAAWPKLPTSHDIVQRVRRLSGQRRIGHTGTLDPMAGGVLVLCLGIATRLVEYYQGHDKRYLAEITLGAETDTYDALGAVTNQQPVPDLDSQRIEAVLRAFTGEIEQKPPIYSALKQDGESLHRKARRGEAVEVAARPVTIYSLELVTWTPPARLLVRVHCSAGTYVRSLAHDLGVALGTCAHLSYLRREAVGNFVEQNAHTLDEIEDAAKRNELTALLRAAGDALDLPAVVLDVAGAERIGHGQKVWLDLPTRPTGDLIQAHDDHAQLLGILRILQRAENGVGALCKAEKWLAPHLDQVHLS
ncbi:MAG: tRNA pseudouridine(55) synthase TruB [Caldilineaceae bacterium]|nr:tRNA pseudouridine(55) synthase TruB [Caldilineaceae bacterium]